MRKPTLVYATILSVCLAGLWGIIRAGSHLSAVTDLAGEWRIESGPLGPGPGGPERLGETFVLDQSGRFFRVRFAGGRVMDLKATAAPLGRLTQRPEKFELTGGPQQVAATVWQDGDRVAGSFRLSGPEAAEFVAHRVPPGGAKKPAAPATRPIAAAAAVDEPPED